MHTKKFLSVVFEESITAQPSLKLINLGFLIFDLVEHFLFGPILCPNLLNSAGLFLLRLVKGCPLEDALFPVRVQAS